MLSQKIKSTLVAGVCGATTAYVVMLTVQSEKDREEWTATVERGRLRAGAEANKQGRTGPRSTLRRRWNARRTLSRWDERRLEELEGRLAAVEQSGEVAEQERALGDFEVDELEPEVERQNALDDWQGRLEEHASQPVNVAWARETQGKFEQDLVVLSDSLNARVLETDCRTNTCTSRIEFANYDDAVMEYGTLLHHNYTVNCTQGTILPEPDDRTQPYMATLLFECGKEQG